MLSLTGLDFLRVHSLFQKKRQTCYFFLTQTYDKESMLMLFAREEKPFHSYKLVQFSGPLKRRKALLNPHAQKVVHSQMDRDQIVSFFGLPGAGNRGVGCRQTNAALAVHRGQWNEGPP